MRLDLHLHSQASDGSEPPSGVVEAAAAGRLDVIALTDHDTTQGLDGARAAAARVPIEIVSGIEISTAHAGRGLHILGYFVDPSTPRLRAYETRARHRREERMREMIQRLAARRVHVRYESVVEVAGPSRRSLGRPHLARTLVAEGYADSLPDAFDRLIGNQHPAYVPTAVVSAEEAIRIILESGGIPVWAHPPYELLEGLLPGLKLAGLRGIEVYRPRTSPERILSLERIARSWNLLMTGGSDWHGPDSGTLGDFCVFGDEVAGFLEAGGM